MNTELIKTVETARAAIAEAKTLLQKVAAGDVKHEAKTETEVAAVPVIDADKLRSVFEDLAVAHLAKTEEIGPAVEAVVKDPNVLLDTIQKLGSYCAGLQVNKTAEATPRTVGTLVKKTASAFGPQENKVQKFKRMCQEKARMLP